MATNPRPTELHSLPRVTSAGAPLAPALKDRFLKRFDVPPRVVQVWGLTECGWLPTFKYPGSEDIESVGWFLPGCEVRICNEGDPRNENSKGELRARGPQVMTGYLGDESATIEAIRADGWFYTGDTGYIKDERVDIVGHIKDIIKVDGFVVSPTELEDTLHECPGVSDCDASGKGYGVDEHSLPFVVAAADTLSVNRFRKHLHSNLSSYKTDQCEVHFVEPIPRNRGGKTLCETNSSKELSKLKVHNLIMMEPQRSACSSIRKYQVFEHLSISLQATLPKMLFFLQKAPSTVCRLSFAALIQGYHGCRRLTNCAGYAYMRATIAVLLVQGLWKVLFMSRDSP